MIERVREEGNEDDVGNCPGIAKGWVSKYLGAR